MNMSSPLPLSLPSAIAGPAALALVVAGVGLLGLAFFILFSGSAEGLSGMRLWAATASFAGGLLLPTIVAAGLLLAPPAAPALASGARTTREADAPQEIRKPAPNPTAQAAKGTTDAGAPLAPATKATVEVDSAAVPTKAGGVTIKRDPATVARGKTLVTEQNCLACHRIDGKGGSVGPDLSDVASRRDADWMMRHFKDPQAVSPGTLMPKFQLTDADFAALTAYLLSPRGQ